MYIIIVHFIRKNYCNPEDKIISVDLYTLFCHFWAYFMFGAGIAQLWHAKNLVCYAHLLGNT